MISGRILLRSIVATAALGLAAIWLANHPEPGQTYEQFVQGGFNQPDASRDKI